MTLSPFARASARSSRKPKSLIPADTFATLAAADCDSLPRTAAPQQSAVHKRTTSTAFDFSIFVLRSAVISRKDSAFQVLRGMAAGSAGAIPRTTIAIGSPWIKGVNAVCLVGSFEHYDRYLATGFLLIVVKDR